MREKAKAETSQERDSRVEATFTFHKDSPRQSVPEYVSTHRDELALEFFDWKAKGQAFDGDLDEMLSRWEDERFGRPLEPSTHGMILFAIKYRERESSTPKDCLFASDEERDRLEHAVATLAPIEHEGTEAKCRRIAITAGLKVPIEKAAKPVREIPLTPVHQNDTIRLPYRDDDNPPSREPGEDDDPWMEAQDD